MSNVFKGVEGAMRGYRPQVDWGGDEGPATIKVGSHNVQVGTAGWRKRCLFILLFSLFLISVVNIILTLWILRKIALSTDGVGNLHILTGGIELQGASSLDDEARISKIKGQNSKDLNIRGYYNITMATMNRDGFFTSGYFIDSKNMIIASNNFQVKNAKGNFLYGSNTSNSSTDAKFFTVTGKEGAVFKSSLQTPRVRGSHVHEFRVESKTRSIKSLAGNLLRIEARDGDVTISAIKDIRLTSSKAKFRFESSVVFLSSLLSAENHTLNSQAHSSTTPPTETQIVSPVFGPDSDSTIFDKNDSDVSANKEVVEKLRVYQVCVCPSGKLFLVVPESVCIPDQETCL